MQRWFEIESVPQRIARGFWMLSMLTWLAVGPLETRADAAVSLPLAQVQFGPEVSGAGGSAGSERLGMKLLMIGAAFLVAGAFCFFVEYKFLLESLRRGPRDAYGTTAATIVLLTCAVALWAFWDDLVIRQVGAETGWFQIWGPRIGAAFVGMLFSAAMTVAFRSSQQVRDGVKDEIKELEKGLAK